MSLGGGCPLFLFPISLCPSRHESCRPGFTTARVSASLPDFLPSEPGPKPFHSVTCDALLAQARPHIPQVFVGLSERGGVNPVHGKFRVFFDQQDSALDERQIIHGGSASVSV